MEAGDADRERAPALPRADPFVGGAGDVPLDDAADVGRDDVREPGREEERESDRPPPRTDEALGARVDGECAEAGLRRT